MYLLIRQEFVRGKLTASVTVTSFYDYYPIAVMDTIRLDCADKDIPRMMFNADGIYGKMDKSHSVIEVARQHKFTAPKTYVRYIITDILI